MKSMTGYAYCESANENTTVSVEIKGYNNRFLDLSIYLPPWLPSLEPELREYISARFMRGKIEASVRIKEHNQDLSVTINEKAAAAYKTAIEALAKKLGIKEKPGLGTLLGLEGVLETETARDAERYRLLVEPVLASAADRFEAERAREGKHTEENILSHLSILEKSVQMISALVPELELAIKENLRERFTEILGGSGIDENRILAETAVLLMKYTISEELSRLSSHLAEFRSETERNPSPGKKLDFLCQEINREVNTIGSKTQALDVSRAVVEMKNALENIREQLRNVE